jgi:hypothetical protein
MMEGVRRHPCGTEREKLNCKPVGPKYHVNQSPIIFSVGYLAGRKMDQQYKGIFEERMEGLQEEINK